VLANFNAVTFAWIFALTGLAFLAGVFVVMYAQSLQAAGWGYHNFSRRGLAAAGIEWDERKDGWTPDRNEKAAADPIRLALAQRVLAFKAEKQRRLGPPVNRAIDHVHHALPIPTAALAPEEHMPADHFYRPDAAETLIQRFDRVMGAVSA
jgi:hypothetical protein